MFVGGRSIVTLAALVAIAVPASATAEVSAPVPVGPGRVVPATTPGAAAVAPPLAPATPKRRANQWYEGNFDPGPTYDCITQMGEPLGSAWTGWYGDIGVSPQTNQVYYVKAGWGVSGFPCTGGAGVHVEFVLPAYTQLAISGNNPVRCWYEGKNQNSLHEFGGGDCPQNPQNGLNGGYAFDPPGNQGPWPSSTGTITEIWVPVKTSQPLNGIESAEGQPCYTCVYAGIWFIDGWNSPWAWPREGVYVVGSGTTTAPLVTYPGPPVTDPDQPIFYDTTGKYIVARMNGNIFNSGSGGNAYFQFGTQAGNYDPPTPDLAIPGGSDFLVYSDFGFPPGKTVHWRFCYRPTSSSPICGADQVYAPPPETGIQDIAVKKKKKTRSATVSFASPPVPNMTVHFQCKLDSKPYKTCSSPVKYPKLKKGNHTVSIRAVDQDGHKDATPAKQAFKA